jgi:hypothetical protein
MTDNWSYTKYGEMAIRTRPSGAPHTRHPSNPAFTGLSSAGLDEWDVEAVDLAIPELTVALNGLTDGQWRLLDETYQQIDSDLPDGEWMLIPANISFTPDNQPAHPLPYRSKRRQFRCSGENQ